jgi:UDP-N-acetylmuramoylalanine--D-glutamate ligase
MSIGLDFTGKRVMVIGLARTGTEMARFLGRRGATVIANDGKGAAELTARTEELRGLPVEFRLGGEEPAWLEGVDLVIPSPGVPPTNRLLRAAGERGVPILSEIEIAYRFLETPLVAVTGTNGKSTTSTLIARMLATDGRKAFAGGNLGEPLIGFVGGEWDWGVVEVSSFQLEHVEEFRPRIAILLNVTEDHLDRYPDLAAYRAAKERIFAAQAGDDLAVLNRDDPEVWSHSRKAARARVVSFGWSEVSEGVFATPNGIVWREKGREEIFPLARMLMRGVHNVENLMAAAAAALSIPVEPQSVQEAIDRFPGLEHRLEFVREKDGVSFYNDSKATNVGAAVKSLASFPGPVILLAGGLDKGGSYAPLAGAAASRVKKLVLFGAAREVIRRALGHLAETVVVETMEEAVLEASRSARPKDIILLSPACASFDAFANYAARGARFKEIVNGL